MNLALVQSTIMQFLTSNDEISENFASIFSSPSFEEVKVPSLIVDLISVEKVEFYGFFNLRYFFTIVANTRSKALELLDILFKEVNRKTYINDTDKISVYFEYTGTYDEILDTVQKRIFINTIWLIRASFL